MRSDIARESGFTLLEVLAAILIVSLVFGILLESVTRNLADLSRARAEARAAQAAENRMRDLRAELEMGDALKDGIQEGVFEEPDSDLHWQISVVPQSLTLPADYKGELAPSPLFQPLHERAPAPAASGQEPPLRVVQVRVYTAEQDPESVDPYVFLVASPPDPSKLQGLPQQPGQTPGQTGKSQGGSGQAGATVDPNTGALVGPNPWQNPGMR
ncbi:MAG TPA: prepilin-type N-terminal cleavage/methylation domain-containing protein [Myxococcota bacterium]|nr:prepilin-type N-terminal cleavage/methylation domain-containing protein [Myxococcota bacterium]